MGESPYPEVYFSRRDEGDDALFDGWPALDGAAAGVLREQVLASVLPAEGAVLDLMSGARTHLPDALRTRHVAGVGVSAAGMADNPRLSERVVQDLNAAPRLPFPDARFDAAVCSAGVPYLTRPLDVFAEVRRVLKVGAPFVVSFGGACAEDKAVWVWLYTDDEKHRELVSDYFRRTGFVRVVARRHRVAGGQPLFTVTGYRGKRG